MPLITAVNLSKSYDPVDIFEDVSVSIPHRARIGLVGPNGVGKTTLLRILAGEETPTDGSVHRARDIRIGYLPQESIGTTEGTLWQECLRAFEELLKLQETLAGLEKRMSDPNPPDGILEQYGKLQHNFEVQGGYTYETRIRQVLSGLGFTAEDFHRPMEQLSGGQRTRALLARLLLSEPHLLLLDEPTNHLDIAAIEWLEMYLKEWEGAVVCVSHDRYFLDQVVTTIWEMTPTLEIYHGNYSAYLQQRAERYRNRLEEYKRQQQMIEKEEEYIRRNIAGQNTRQAQGRRKRLERMLEEAQVAAPRTQSRGMKLRLSTASRSGDLVLRTYGLQVGYADADKALFEVPDLILQRGECTALLGPNGAGKTTFLKTILGEIPPLSGEVNLGAGLKIGYYAQAREDLNPEWTLMEEIDSLGTGMLPADIRSYLAKYLFTGDDVFKLTSVLSGGERGRLALAKLALMNANFLLLDEPTNHLDLPSQEILQSILADFPGTILLVSHDRYLVDALATQIWEILPEGSLRVFKGSYTEYKASQIEAVRQESAAIPTATRKGPKAEELARRKAVYAERRLQQRRQELEALITQLEERIQVIGRRLENPPSNLAEVHRLGLEYQELQEELNRRLEEWAGL